MKNQTVIFFVRHGQTDYPHTGDIRSDNNRVLTELGERQVWADANYLKDFNPMVIYVSPFKRCQQSAKIVQKVTSVEIITDNRLAEAFNVSQEKERGRGLTDFIKEVAKKHAGEIVIAVTHQLEIISVMESMMPTDCPSAAICRVVLTGDKIVQKQMLYPAKNL